MTVQAWLIFTPAQKASVQALNDDDTAISPRAIDNPLANNLGYGALQTNTNSVAPARILNDPDYSRFWTICGTLPIQVMDSDTLFMPPPQV
jgi:hypothetical protein